MKGYSLAQVIVLGFCIFCLCANADEQAVPIFNVVSSRSYLDPPSVEVVFPNGFQDEFVLEHYNPFKRLKGGHSYIGYLKNTPGSSVAVSGNLANPEDRMEITLLSRHTKDEGFVVDYNGKTSAIPIPIEDIEITRTTALNREEEKNQDGNFTVEEGDEEVKAGHWTQHDPSVDLYHTRVKMPSKLKMVMKFGYTEGIAKELKEQGMPEFSEFIEHVLVHTQARFFDLGNSSSLGTMVQLEVQEGFLKVPNDTLGIWGAKTVTNNNFDVKDVATTAWWEPSTGSARGFLGNLCNSYAVTCNHLLGNKENYAFKSGWLVFHETWHNMAGTHERADEGYGGACSYDSGYFTSCSRADFYHLYSLRQLGYGCLEDISRPCTRDTCKNGGTCTESNGEFTCTCPSGVTGDRCEHNPDGCKGVDGCCTSENKCGEWDGNCASDSDCEDGLICGYRNCPRKYGDGWNIGDNCCFKPDLEAKATCEGWQPDSLPIMNLPKSPRVSCGGHLADTCSECPLFKGEEWCNGDCKWSNNECVSVVSCGEHTALTCSDCPQGHGASWCNGDCFWKNDDCVSKEEGVSCGEHTASTCSDCPQGHGASWCNGDCAWTNDECVRVEGSYFR